MDDTLKKQILAETVGTFCLVFAGAGAIVVNNASAGAVSHVGIALTFGLVVMAMIYAIGDISGAHINPAVTLAFTVAQRFPFNKVAPYVIAQCSGAILACLCLKAMFPGDQTLGATLPAGSILQTFIMEVILTFMLMWVILSVSTGAKEEGITAGLAVGAVVGLEALMAGPICGASMNPARSLGPAIVSLNLTVLWVYLVAPPIGALLAVPIYRAMRDKPQLRNEEELNS